MEVVMISRYVSAAFAIFVCAELSLLPAAWAAEPAQPAKTAISDEAKEAVQRMGKTLAAEDVSFKAPRSASMRMTRASHCTFSTQ